MSKRTWFHQLESGAWFKPEREHYDQCCDCGKVHKLKFEIRDGEVWFKAQDMPRLTAQARKKRRITL